MASCLCGRLRQVCESGVVCLGRRRWVWLAWVSGGSHDLVGGGGAAQCPSVVVT